MTRSITPKSQLMQNSRIVRVFISSTFNDMQEERDYLLKHVFPEIRNRCRSRQVEFIPIDLRWGITKEQAERGEILSTCLADIDICRPYFIGLIGERYGWIPDKLEENLITEYPWLEKQKGKSITDIEIYYGFLKNTRELDHSFFYFRRKSYLDSIAPSKRIRYIEDSTNEDIEKLGFKEARNLANHKKKKLIVLKKSIRQTGLRPRYYSSLKSLGARLIKDLWAVIDKKYPAIPIKDLFEKDKADHHSFAESRAKAYVPRKDYFEIIESHINSQNAPLFLIGESGVGKTSLLANWAIHHNKAFPNDFLFFHFIGSTVQSTDYEIIIRRIMNEIKHRYDLDIYMPSSVRELRKSFFKLLDIISVKDRMILLIDGLNQLDDRDNSQTLNWLPDVIPPHIRIVGSTVPGRTLNAIVKRKWLTLNVELLEPSERHEIIVKYLDQFRKKLEGVYIQRIISSNQSANPLYLRALLEELRVYGDNDMLGAQLDRYLTAPDALALYDMILERMEGDYGRGREGLVKDSLSLIWASDRGLYENELLELLRDRNDPLPRAIWSPFYLAIQESLVNRSGQLNFFHDYLRQAVKNKYLRSRKEEFEVHKQLSKYYECMFSEAGAFEDYRTMSLKAAENALNASEKSKSKELKAEACLLYAGSLISAAIGISHENANLFKKAWEMAKKACDLVEGTKSRNTQLLLASGLCLRSRVETGYNPEYGNIAHINRAIKIYRQFKEWGGEDFSRYGVTTSYGDALYEKAVIGLRFGKWNVVEKSLTEAQRIAESLPDWDPLKKAHISQVWGEYFALRGRWDKAKDILKRAMKEYRLCKYPGGVCAAKGWIGLSLCGLGDQKKGLSLVKEALKFERDELRSQEGAAKWLHYLGEHFWQNNEKKRALHAFWFAEELRESQNHAELLKTKKKLKEIKRVNKKEYDEIRYNFAPRNSEFSEYAFLWGLGPFHRYDRNPILAPQGDTWESRAVFNPAAWTDGTKVYLLYRAEGPEKGNKRGFISNIGLAESDNGIYFHRNPLPVMTATESYERDGGCEDPRIVFINDIYYMTYTAYDGNTARLSIATSGDLRRWKKLGPIFTDEQLSDLEESNLPKGWSKSGAIYNEKIDGYYWMFFGDNHIWAAKSRDLRKWEIIRKPVLSPRPDSFDSYLVEAGPPCIALSDPGPPPVEGIWLGYNAAEKTQTGRLSYSFGQALLDPKDPTKVIRRCTRPLLKPERPHELNGQVPQVVFCEGLIFFKGRWLLYYGMADSRIGVATADVF